MKQIITKLFILILILIAMIYKGDSDRMNRELLNDKGDQSTYASSSAPAAVSKKISPGRMANA